MEVKVFIFHLFQPYDPAWPSEANLSEMLKWERVVFTAHPGSFVPTPAKNVLGCRSRSVMLSRQNLPPLDTE